MNKIRAAVVGAGIYGKHHMNAYLHNPDTVLVAICDTDTERCDDLAMTCGVMGYTRLDVLLQEEAIDVVSVATPDPYHTESILTALRHGKHVLAEKPLATSVRECELIVEMAQQRGLLVGVDFHKRWDPAVMRIKAELEKPETGRILRGHISMDDVITVPTDWLDWAGASSPVWFLGSHCFDLVRHLSGQEVVSVYAAGQNAFHVIESIRQFVGIGRDPDHYLRQIPQRGLGENGQQGHSATQLLRFRCHIHQRSRFTRCAGQ